MSNRLLSFFGAASSAMFLVGCGTVAQAPRIEQGSVADVKLQQAGHNRYVLTYPSNNPSDPVGSIVINGSFERRADGRITSDEVLLVGNVSSARPLTTLPGWRRYYACSQFRGSDAGIPPHQVTDWTEGRMPQWVKPWDASAYTKNMRMQVLEHVRSSSPNLQVRDAVAQQTAEKVVELCHQGMTP